MNNTPINSNKRNRAVQLYAILSLLSVGILVHSIAKGDFVAQISKVRSLAQLAGSTSSLFNGGVYSTGTASGVTNPDITPLPFSLDAAYNTDTSITPQVVSGDVVSTQVKGIVTLRAKIVSDNVVFVINSPQDTSIPTKVITIADGIHRSTVTGMWEYNLDTTTLKNTYFYLKAAYYSPNRVWLYTGNTSFMVSNVVAGTTPAPSSTPPVVETLAPFDPAATYPTNTALYPKIISGAFSSTASGATSYYQVKGKTLFHIDTGSVSAMFVISSRDNSASKLILGADKCAHLLSSGTAWECEFDTTTLADASYVIKAIYASTSNSWINSNNLIFYVKNTIPDFSPTAAYAKNTSIIPKIYKEDLALKTKVELYTSISGNVLLSVDNIPSEKAILLLGTESGWLSNGIFSDKNGINRELNTNRWVFNLNTTAFPDGYYRLGAAYFDRALNDWALTGVKTGFIISNKVTTVVPPVLVTTVVHEESPVLTQAEVQAQIDKTTNLIKPTEYQAINQVTTTKTDAPTVTKPTTVVEVFKPVLRLVVNDRQITDLKHTFDSEETEIRATTLPAKSVQFFAYAVDGAFKPVLKELGQGVKDDILSREGKEVWTYITDMREYPTGNFRLFARVRGLDGNVVETQSIPIVVQHLFQMGTVPTASTDTTPVLTKEARQSILERVTDPSGCQNRQECEVFCSNNNSSQGKCLSFARSNDSQVSSSSAIEIKKNRVDADIKITALFPDLQKRIDDIRSDNQAEQGVSTTPTEVGTSTQMSSTSLASLSNSTTLARSSVMDIIPKSVIEDIVSIKDKIDINLPEEVKTATDLHQYCGVVEHEGDCIKAIDKIAPELKANVEKQAEVVRQDETKTLQLLGQRSGARSFLDSDGDGITDFDEVNFYHTDPSKRDTNGDGYTDGYSILGQINPLVLGASTSTSESKIVLSRGLSVENPKITGSTQEKQFSVTSVAPIEFKDNKEGKKEVSKVLFKGVALPNSFVKIFLFSDPIVVTVRTDDNGNWFYELDKTLPDGAHTAYVAMADGGGRILAKSAPLPFVKEASAITVNSAQAGPIDTGATIMGLSPITLIALFVGILGLALSIVGVVIGLKFHDQNKPDINITA